MPAKYSPSRGSIPAELEACWYELKKHPYYRKKGDLNQHALDLVHDVFGDQLWFKPDNVVSLRKDIVNAATRQDTDLEQLPWAWPSFIFYYATTENGPIDNHPAPNSHRWHWQPQHHLFKIIWGIKDE
jgi:hypothetical protein